jgi:hypothetical protein
MDQDDPAVEALLIDEGIGFRDRYGRFTWDEPLSESHCLASGFVTQDPLESLPLYGSGRDIDRMRDLLRKWRRGPLAPEEDAELNKLAGWTQDDRPTDIGAAIRRLRERQEEHKRAVERLEAKGQDYLDGTNAILYLLSRLTVEYKVPIDEANRLTKELARTLQNRPRQFFEGMMEWVD